MNSFAEGADVGVYLVHQGWNNTYSSTEESGQVCVKPLKIIVLKASQLKVELF